MSDIQISYSSKLIKHIINNALFLNIFTIEECNDYLKDGNKPSSLAIHYLERKQSAILYLFMMKIIAHEPDLYNLIKYFIGDMDKKIGVGSKYCNGGTLCKNFKHDSGVRQLDIGSWLKIGSVNYYRECNSCVRTSYGDVFSIRFNYHILQNGLIYADYCRSVHGCYCSNGYYSSTECLVCELCELGLYCDKRADADHTRAIIDKPHRNKNKFIT